MPTYEYACRKCRHVFEKQQSMSAAPLKRCPECGGAVRRVINGGLGAVFKGRGFHQTDRRKGRLACGADAPCRGKDSPCLSGSCDPN